jgi:hypothetical protein
MANEIKIVTNLTAAKGHASFARSRTVQADWATARVSIMTQAIGNGAHEALTPPADLATNGWAIFTNLDPTNYIEIGRDVAAAFVPMARLNAGESACFRVAQGVTLYAKANTASCDLEWALLHN